MRNYAATGNKALLVSMALVMFSLAMFFGGSVRTLMLQKDVLPLFIEFTVVTSSNFPSEEDRNTEMFRIVKKAEHLVGEKCVVSMVAHNPGTVSRNDELRLGCGVFSNPGPGKLTTVAEYRHRDKTLKVY